MDERTTAKDLYHGLLGQVHQEAIFRKYDLDSGEYNLGSGECIQTKNHGALKRTYSHMQLAHNVVLLIQVTPIHHIIPVMRGHM